MTREAGQSWGTMEKITRMPPPGITRRDWHDLLDALIELEAAGALGGIAAIVTERLRQVRNGRPARRGGIEEARAGMPDAGLLDAPRIAALLAAEIDRAGPS